MTRPFETLALADADVVEAPDGSSVRVLLAARGGSMARFALAPGQVACAVVHKTVDELWTVSAGAGRLWRRQGEQQAEVDLLPGVCVSIPCGTAFQFRADAATALEVLAVTMPPWPGPDEAVLVDGPWAPMTAVPAQASSAARNVEIKARVSDLAALEVRTRSLATSGPTPIAQDDTFFACPAGRLKLRAFADGSGELIQYARADAAGPKTSSYVRVPTGDPDALREALARAHGVIGRVRKARTLYLVGRTRVHLDRVEGLGDFVELEVVLAPGEPAEVGDAEAAQLMRRLGIGPEALVAGAYLDLLRAASPNSAANGSAERGR